MNLFRKILAEIAMHWGETQSLFQIATALNLAFFSFREIRAPVKQRIERNRLIISGRLDSTWKKLSDAVDAAIDGNQILTNEQFNDYYRKHEGFRDRLKGLGDASDRFFKAIESAEAFALIPTLLMALLSAVILVHSTYNYNNEVSNFVVTVLSILSFSPVVFFMCVNGYTVLVPGRTLLQKYAALNAETGTFAKEELSFRLSVQLIKHQIDQLNKRR